MSITVAPTLWGYHVTIRSRDRKQFAATVESFKEAIPRRCRLFQPQQGCWYVERRSQRRLNGWIAKMREAGAKVYESEK